MSFSNYLKGQLADFVDCYKKYFWQTLGTVLIYTVLCFVAMALLLKFSDFDTTSGKKQVSLLSYLFTRYSVNVTYSLVDLAKSVFLFFVSLFSVGLLRMTTNDTDEQKELSFSSFTKKLRGWDIFALLGILIFCSAIDLGLFRLDTYSETTIKNFGLQKWFHSILFLLRIYIPMILFSLTLYKLTSGKPLTLTIKKIVFLFVSLWLFNEFAYEVSIFVRAHIFGLLLAPFDQDKQYLYESLLGTTLIAFYFLGYYSAMTKSLKQLEEQ